MQAKGQPVTAASSRVGMVVHAEVARPVRGGVEPVLLQSSTEAATACADPQDPGGPAGPVPAAGQRARPADGVRRGRVLCQVRLALPCLTGQPFHEQPHSCRAPWSGCLVLKGPTSLALWCAVHSNPPAPAALYPSAAGRQCLAPCGLAEVMALAIACCLRVRLKGGLPAQVRGGHHRNRGRGALAGDAEQRVWGDAGGAGQPVRRDGQL